MPNAPDFALRGPFAADAFVFPPAELPEEAPHRGRPFEAWQPPRPGLPPEGGTGPAPVPDADADEATELAFDIPPAAKPSRTDKPGGGKGRDKGPTESPPADEPVSDPADPAPAPVPDVYTSGLDTAGGYNVEVVFSGSWTDALKQAFVTASELISDLILGDLPDLVYNGVAIDDVRIEASLASIDGTGGVLGQAGPTVVRSDSYLPIQGMMQFDAADADAMLSQGVWGDVVFHEMMHAVGFGPLWSYMGLITEVNGELRFNGENARAAYAAGFPEIAASDPLFEFGVPVESDGGAGTAGGHWDEAIFGTEVMTGYADRDNYLSDLTVAALEDMGYDTAWDAGLLA